MNGVDNSGGTRTKGRIIASLQSFSSVVCKGVMATLGLFFCVVAVLFMAEKTWLRLMRSQLNIGTCG